MSSPSASTAVPGAEEKIYRVGTLQYTQRDLYTLFFWLMWNDFAITLLEQVSTLTGFLYKDFGATNTEIATFGSITGLLSVWLNPVCSTWSDRTRTKYGRRRPFIFLATPIFAFFLMNIPFMPGLYLKLAQVPSLAPVLQHLPIRGEVLFIFFASFMAGMFNAMVLAIFSYLYWDVVPANVLGRFNALAKIISSLALFVWKFFFFGMGQDHMKAVYVGVSIFCLLFYLISTWKIKEGDYPPPDEPKKGGRLALIRAYFVECFAQPYFLWIFLAFTLYQLNNIAGQYQGFYLHYNLGLSLDSIGKMSGLPLLLPIVLAFGIGTITDKFNPVRLMAPTYLIWGAMNFAGYFFVKGQWSYLILVTGTTLMMVVSGIVTSAFTVRVYPMEKLGQFCSASAISSQVTCALVLPLMAHIYDLTSNRVAFLWSANALFAASLLFYKVYLNWKKRHGHAPLPHAG